MAFEHYIFSDGKQLRCGFTTGTCAALAASAAAQHLLTGIWQETVSLMTPKGISVKVSPEEMKSGAGFSSCGVRKDAGDDVDCTAGLLICARVEFADTPGIKVDGGIGVGRVTKAGLDQPVGAAAINSVPREMIKKAVEDIAALYDCKAGLSVTVFVPDGAAAAEKTFNPRLGIEGGISILGTSGIVEPMSRQAIVDTITIELRQQALAGYDRVILTPGNYGKDFLKANGMDKLNMPVVICSNFIGDALDAAVGLGFKEILLVGHIGKLVKLAGGIMNTHSKTADCRTELICAHAALQGAEQSTCRSIMDAVTTDACIEILKEHGICEAVIDSLMTAIERHLAQRVGKNVSIAAVMFSNVYGILGQTSEAFKIMEGQS